MTGYTNQNFIKTKNKFCIHFDPGARGDFLGSILTNSFVERRDNALSSPNYLKIHHKFKECTIPKNFTVIRIDDNKITDSIMQITLNSFEKNPTDMLKDKIDHFYTRIKNVYYELKELIDPTIYDYWIDFRSLSDINFLKDFYYHFNGHEIDKNLLEKINNNINKQTNWKLSPELVSLSQLVDFELKFNLISWCKTFSIQEYMSAARPNELLTIKNYSRTPFVL